MADIISEFSEAQYQSYIESCFINEFRGHEEFDIHYFSGVDEQSIGYDMRIDTYIPIFLQMKRSGFYFSHSRNTDMENRRNILGFTDNPGAYFFYLHVDSDTKDYLQHNLLVDLSNNYSYVRYIAPNFVNYNLLKRLKYRIDSIYSSFRIESELNYGGNITAWRDHLIFPHSVLIKPHARQTKVNGIHHKYFFNRQRQISFHSEPEKIDAGESYKDFISNINQEFRANINQNSKSLDKIFDKLKSIIFENLGKSNSEKSDENLLKSENEYIENNIVFNEFKGIEQLEYSPRNFYILTNYLDKRFSIRTLLAGKRLYDFDEI